MSSLEKGGPPGVPCANRRGSCTVLVFRQSDELPRQSISDANTWQTAAAFLTLATVFAILVVLHAVLPARRVDGYAYRGAAGTPRYRLNGIAVFAGALVIWWLELTFAPLGWFWQAARHMNYTGEILEALGMALALGHLTNLWAWVYFVYLTVFFVVRERVDDRRCAGKYGELWTQYKAKVRYRLVPGVY